MQNQQHPVAIIGGTGVVGREIVRLLRRRHPQLPLLLMGRSQEKGKTLAEEVGKAQFYGMDVTDPAALQQLTVKPLAIISVVNDPHDHILHYAIEHNIALVDITRWNTPLREAMEYVQQRTLHAPVMFASAWMAGIAPLAALSAAADICDPVTIEIDILYAMSDKSGPNSVEFMDQLHVPFPVTVGGNTAHIQPLRDSKRTVFPGRDGPKTFCTHRFGTPEQLTLPMNGGIEQAVTRISFDSSLATGLLVGLVRSGLWQWVSGERFTSLRRALLHHPGKGGRAMLRATAGSRDVQRSIVLSDPLGQRHLTAVGAVIQLERVLGLDGARPPVGMTFPEHTPVLEKALATMRACGVQIELEQPRTGCRDGTDSAQAA